MSWRNISGKMLEYIMVNKGKVLGAIIGLIFAVLILVIGIRNTLIITGCTLAGFLFGAQRDRGGNFKKIINKIIPTK